MTQQGNDVYLTLGPSETLVFRNNTIAGFKAGDFELPVKPTQSVDSFKWYIGKSSTADTFYGTSAPETFQGRGGKDVFGGGGGDDIYYIDTNTTIIEKALQGIDTAITFGSGTFNLAENVENLLLQHSATGVGNKLGNYIRGSSGADTINGKAGNDWLVGGAGHDTFIIEKGTGFDTIEDFKAKSAGGGEVDTLKLSGYGPGAYLSNDSDLFTVNYNGGEDYFRLNSVRWMAIDDYVFI